MFNDMNPLMELAGEVNTITGGNSQSKTFNAVIGHKYIIAVGSLNNATFVYSGIDIIAQSEIKSTQSFNGDWANTIMIIGVATSSTVMASLRPSDSVYSTIIWIDLDEQ